MDYFDLNKSNYAKYINVLSKYGMLNEGLFSLLDTYDLHDVKAYEIGRILDDYVLNHGEADITINRVIKEILDHKVYKLPEDSTGAKFAQRVVNDLSWCLEFLHVAQEKVEKV